MPNAQRITKRPIIVRTTGRRQFDKSPFLTSESLESILFRTEVPVSFGGFFVICLRQREHEEIRGGLRETILGFRKHDRSPATHLCTHTGVNRDILPPVHRIRYGCSSN